jgi:hypothetical protein
MSELPRIYVTLEETAQMMGYKSRCSVSRKIKAGELEARGKGKGLRVVYASVLRHPDYLPERKLN